VVCDLKRVTVNSSHGQLVTQSTRHRSTRHPVDSSHGQLVTERRSTRHKQTNKQTSNPYCRSSIITLTRSPRSPPLRKKCTRNWAEKQSEQQSTCTRWPKISPRRGRPPPTILLLRKL